jgi:hypothetical protein
VIWRSQRNRIHTHGKATTNGCFFLLLVNGRDHVINKVFFFIHFPLNQTIWCLRFVQFLEYCIHTYTHTSVGLLSVIVMSRWLNRFQIVYSAYRILLAWLPRNAHIFLNWMEDNMTKISCCCCCVRHDTIVTIKSYKIERIVCFTHIRFSFSYI